MNKSFGVVLPIAFVAISGCTTVSQGFVAREWTDNMRELGIYPLFPPRADVRVGDVFVNIVEEPDSATANATPALPKHKNLGVHFASVSMAGLLLEHYKDRTVFAAAPANPTSAPAIAATPSSGFKLKTVAFPIFLRATATGADIEGLIPVDGLPIKGGLGANSVKSASVTVSSAESYSVPWSNIYSAINSGSSAIFTTDGKMTGTALAALKTIAPKESTKGVTDVTFVNEVYFARSFDVTFSLTSDAAATVAKSLAASKGTEAAAVPATSASNPAASAPRAGASAAQEMTTPTAEALAAAEELKRNKYYSDVISKVPSIAGVTMGASVSSSGTVGLRTNYDEPIAIGYRGVTIRVNLSDGSWVARPKAGDDTSNISFSSKTSTFGNEVTSDDAKSKEEKTKK